MDKKKNFSRITSVLMIMSCKKKRKFESQTIVQITHILEKLSYSLKRENSIIPDSHWQLVDPEIFPMLPPSVKVLSACSPYLDRYLI